MSTEEEAPTDPGWDDLEPEQKQRLLQLASGGVTRRDILAGGGALLAGGAIGGGASQALTEPAAASHGAGSVGEAGNPIDTAYVTSISGDGDKISLTPGFGAVDIDSLGTGADVSNAYSAKVIDPTVSDVGAAVNTAISELAPGGGRIILPAGTLPLGTSIDLSVGGSNRENSTPIILEGQGAHAGTTSGNEAGTTLDCSGVADHAIKQAGATSTSHLYLRDFALTSGGSSIDAVHFTGANTTHSEIRNVAVKDGFRYGFKLHDMYGSEIGTISATRTAQGIYLQRNNAASFGVVTARETSGNTTYAVEVVNGVGMEVDQFYIESNDGPALSVVGGTLDGVHIKNLYLENNNRSGDVANTREVTIGDTSINDNFATEVRITSAQFRSTANAFGTERFYFGKAGNASIHSVRGSPDVFAASTSDGTFYDSGLGTVDSNSGAWYWLNNTVGTDNRDAGDTIL